MKCRLCPHKCGAYRDNNTKGGNCQSSLAPSVGRIAPHYWEEPPISGNKGSGAVFFAGCTLKCVYCQNFEISHNLIPCSAISCETLADEIKRLEETGVHNINLVSATHYVPAILKAFEIYKPKIPVVYNSSGYERVETLRSLEGIVDIYLPDFKYSQNDLAEKYSSVPDYREVATKALEEMFRQKGKLTLSQDGIAEKGVLVRHLILPGHTKNSMGVLDILSENFGDLVTVSLMGQYVPCGKAAEYEKLRRKITKREYQKVLSYLIALGLDGFAQELEAADKEYIPSWDYNSKRE